MVFSKGICLIVPHCSIRSIQKKIGQMSIPTQQREGTYRLDIGRGSCRSSTTSQLFFQYQIYCCTFQRPGTSMDCRQYSIAEGLSLGWPRSWRLYFYFWMRTEKRRRRLIIIIIICWAALILMDLCTRGIPKKKNSDSSLKKNLNVSIFEDLFGN